MLNASSRSTASPRNTGAPDGAAPSRTDTAAPSSSVNCRSGSVASTANTPEPVRPELNANAGLSAAA